MHCSGDNSFSLFCFFPHAESPDSVSIHEELFHYLHYKSTYEVKMIIFVLLVFKNSLVLKSLSFEISLATATKLILNRSYPLLLSSSLTWILDLITVSRKGFLIRTTMFQTLCFRHFGLNLELSFFAS